MKKLTFAAFLLLCDFCLWAQQNRTTLKTEEIRTRDPFVCVDQNTKSYYIVTTSTQNGSYALRAFESKDLENWTERQNLYVGNEGWMAQMDPKTDHWWAPDTYLYKGKWYTIITVACKAHNKVNFCTLLEGGKTPSDPYKMVIKDGEPICLTPPGQQCLDGSLYIDQKGKPWLVYSLEWNGADVQDHIGETWAIRLKKDLKGTIGKPIRLFRASEATWRYDANGVMVVDAPFLWPDKESGNLICLWSSFNNGVYCVGQAISKSGKIEGPWEHLPDPIYMNGGHEMIFKDLEGNLKMSLHHNNNDARVKIVDVKIENGRFVAKP